MQQSGHFYRVPWHTIFMLQSAFLHWFEYILQIQMDDKEQIFGTTDGQNVFTPPPIDFPKTAEAGPRYFINESSDLTRELRALLVVDDEPMFCEMLCETLSDALLDTMVIGCCCSDKCPELARNLYFDVVVSDMDMPGLNGNDLLRQIQQDSPTTYRIAATAHNWEMAYLAGRCQPDFFYHKTMPIDTLIAKAGEGLAVAARKREIAYPGVAHINSLLQKSTWRRRKTAGKRLGFKAKHFRTSRSIITALSLLRLRKDLSEDEVAILAGFFQPQKMREKLKKLPIILEQPY